MKKLVMILGASRYYVRSILAAQELGCEVLVTDRNPAAEGFRHADFSAAVDITDIANSIKVAEQHRIDAVVAVNDFGVPTAAAIAARLGLPGISPEVAAYATSKAWMRRIWEKAGVPSARFRVVNTLTEAQAAAEELGTWPLIVKPADSRGGGSRGVSKIETPQELPQAVAFAQSFYAEKSVVIEEFLDGAEHSLETITYDGQTHVLAVSDKEKTPPPYRVDKSVIYPSIYSGQKLDAIQAAAVQAVQALGITSGAAHVELCTTAQGPRLFELGARCGGGGTPDPIVPFLTGVAMFKEVVRIALGERPTRLDPLYTKGCVYRFITPPPGVLRRISGLEDIKAWDHILDCELLVAEGMPIRPVKTGADRAGFIIAGGDDRADALRLADRAERHLGFDIEGTTE